MGSESTRPERFGYKTTSCHKCKWNGRRDAEAEARCVECSRRHIEKDRKNQPLLDWPTDGWRKISMDAASAGAELAHAKTDELALAEMREPTGRVITDFTDGIARRIVGIVRETRTADEGELPRIVREKAGRMIGELNADLEERLLGTLREIPDMNETTLRAVYWMMRGFNLSVAAEKIGVSKQAVSKSLIPFIEKHPAWAALTGNKGTRWQMELNGAG